MLNWFEADLIGSWIPIPANRTGRHKRSTLNIFIYSWPKEAGKKMINAWNFPQTNSPCKFNWRIKSTRMNHYSLKKIHSYWRDFVKAVFVLKKLKQGTFVIWICRFCISTQMGLPQKSFTSRELYHIHVLYFRLNSFSVFFCQEHLEIPWYFQMFEHVLLF